MKRYIFALAVLCTLLGCAVAQQSAPAIGEATSGPSAAASQPTPQPAPASAATAEPAADSAVMAILNRLDEAGRKYPNLVADLHYHVNMVQLGDTEEHTGKVYWQAAAGDAPARFRIHFDTKKQGEGLTPTARCVEDYVFDGSWLTSRKEEIKQMIKRQMAPPGEKIDALQLGQGPFLVPFGQKAENVLRFFSVSTRPAQADDPANTDYLKLVARSEKKGQAGVEWAEMWVAKDTGLPIKIITQDPNENVTTVTFKDIQMPPTLPKDTFDLPQPPRDWEYRVQPYEGAGPRP